MHDSLGVRRIEPVRDLNADLQKLRYFDGFPGNAVLESASLKQLHGDKRTAFEFSNVVDGADVRVIQRRRSARFAPKSLDRLRVLRNIVGKEFQRHVPAKPRVLGLVNHAHPSAAQFFEHGIVGNCATYIRGSVRHRRCIVRQRLHTGNRASFKWPDSSRALARTNASHAPEPA